MAHYHRHLYAHIVRTLRETKEVLVDALTALGERGERLRRLELHTRQLGDEAQDFERRAQRLEARRRLTAQCVVCTALGVCFLMLVAASYFIQR